MRVRAIQRGARSRSDAATATSAPRPSVAALVFLRGRDADGRLREFVAERAQVRPVLGALAAALLDGRGFEPLGFRCLGAGGVLGAAGGGGALRGAGGAHAARLAIRGRAPDGLVYTLGVGRFGSGDVLL